MIRRAAAQGEVRQQVLRCIAEHRSAERLPAGGREVDGANGREPRMCGRPDVLIDDPQVRRRNAEPLAFGPRRLLVHTPPITLATTVSGDGPAVHVAEQHLADGRRRPGLRASSLRPRRQCPVRVQDLGDRLDAVPADRQLEDPADDGRLGLVNPPFDVRSRAARAGNLDVVVSPSTYSITRKASSSFCSTSYVSTMLP